MRRFFWIVVAIGVCMLVGYSARFAQADALMNWYPLLDKPSVMPPNEVFPIAWGIIYVCMGVSVGLLCDAPREDKYPLMLLFAVQLVVNMLWSVSFFYFQNPLLGLVNILVLDYLVVLYAMRSYSVNRLSAWLFVPYVLWLVFATYLNTYIYVMN